MLVPRDYQQFAHDALWQFFQHNVGNPLVLMPTGTGKSILPAMFIQSMMALYPGSRVMLATHVEQLIKQNLAKLLQAWPTAPVGVFSAGLDRYDTAQPIIFGGVQSMYNKAAAFGYVDILFVDEAHLVSPKESGMYATLIAGLKELNPKLKVVGLTATGWRTDNGPLADGGLFTDVAVDMTTMAAWNWFVDSGYLAPLIGKRTNLHMDAEGVPLLGAEYNMKRLEEHVDKEHITQQAVQEMLWWGDAENRNCWMVFATGVNHCEHVAEIMNQHGIPTVAIHSKSKKPGQLIERFARGEWRAAVSMNKLTTGVDIPHIDLIGCMRHTMSSSLWVQMLGRGTRPVYAPGYDLSTAAGRLAAMAASCKPNGCRVLDFARNTENLGPVNDPVVPERRSKRKKAGSRPAPIRVCPACEDYNHPSARFCKACGYEFPMNVYMDGVASDLEVMVRKPVQALQPDPVVERLEVVNVTYAVHRKRNRPDSLRVSYFCRGTGNLPRMYSEYICLEHVGKARDRAVNWWRARCLNADVPATVERALELTEHLRIPTHIRVWVNPPSNHPEIQDYEYTAEYDARLAQYA